jgi:hypothetical protein
VVAALWVVDGHHPAALQQVCPDGGTADDSILVEVDVHILTKATTVVVAHLHEAQHTPNATSDLLFFCLLLIA